MDKICTITSEWVLKRGGVKIPNTCHIVKLKTTGTYINKNVTSVKKITKSITQNGKASLIICVVPSKSVY